MYFEKNLVLINSAHTSCQQSGQILHLHLHLQTEVSEHFENGLEFHSHVLQTQGTASNELLVAPMESVAWMEQ
jgi:hypothetical protein